MSRLPGFRVAACFALAVLCATGAAAQVPVILAPPNIILPNFNGQQPGVTGSLEVGALVARGDDASATWYNPAGLSRLETSSMTGSAGAVQWMWVSPNAFPDKGYSSNHLPVQLGLAWKEPFDYLGWTMAFNFSASNSWEHALSSELQVGTTQAPERFAYAASSKFTRYVASVGGGYTPDKKLRFGGSLDVELTQMNQAQSVNDRILGSPRATSLLVASYSNAAFTHLRLTVGMQYDINEKVIVGATLKTPGIALGSGGSAGLDATLYKNGTTTNLSYYDGSPTMKYKLPFEFAGGLAYNVGRRMTVEGDVRIIQGGGVYTFFSPNRTITGIQDTGTSPAQGFETEARTYEVDQTSVVDVRVGGRILLSEAGKLTLHGGFATNNSPVGETDEVFQQANLLRFTVGLSGEKGKFFFAGGLDWQAGTTPLYDVYTAQNGQVIKTTTNVDGFALVYSFGLRF
jgi:hypothetical protein